MSCLVSARTNASGIRISQSGLPIALQDKTRKTRFQASHVDPSRPRQACETDWWSYRKQHHHTQYPGVNKVRSSANKNTVGDPDQRAASLTARVSVVLTLMFSLCNLTFTASTSNFFSVYFKFCTWQFVKITQQNSFTVIFL